MIHDLVITRLLHPIVSTAGYIHHLNKVHSICVCVWVGVEEGQTGSLFRAELAQRVEAGQHVSPQLHVLALEEVKRTCAADHPTRACHIMTSTLGEATNAP